jgi:hypothetical protein
LSNAYLIASLMNCKRFLSYSIANTRQKKLYVETIDAVRHQLKIPVLIVNL